MSAVEVFAVESGQATGPTVVLSNSLGSDHRMWDPQLTALEERFRVIHYDTRGHGRSPVPAGPYTLDDLADDVVALLDRVGVEQAHLVGLSLGGMTMMRVAARNPDRVNRLVVLCTGAQLPPASNWLDRAALVRSSGSAAIAASVVARWFTPDYLEANPDRREFYQRMVADTPAEGYAGCCDALARLDLRDDLPRIVAPTLAIAGADDVASPPAKLAEIAGRVADGTLLVVPDSCHLANAEQPQTITPAIVKHLEQS
ncbi:3-oxoadipate enol-lactonase [Antrihabitans cavernicola]|uniref:3-oxoadipate enol-lactonase n=1 Tax=Antrihabitans cavernicola TaxID=2495913 RepID=A0A5A7SKK8_9NOCA|nr:3-oxoadipate enol-lactonase [Spelaeibacter cavernicola]KAA0024751.1 3-oxoadipate enol-lactonase [Spelaeibacter cavernicola]